MGCEELVKDAYRSVLTGTISMAREEPPADLTRSEVLHVIARADLNALEDLADRWWFELPARFGPEILELLERLPSSAVSRRPRLLVAGVLAYQLTAEPEDPRLRPAMRLFDVHGARLSRHLNSFSRPGDLVSAGVLAMYAARSHDQFQVAERIGAWIEARQLQSDDNPAVLPWSQNRVTARPGLVALHRGVGAMLAGQPAVAMRHLQRAYEQAGPPPFQHFAGASACAHLALLAAARGQHVMAEAWLERMQGCGPVADWLERYLLLGAAIARALTAIDRLDPIAAARALHQAGTGEEQVELWPYLTAAHVAYAVVFDEPVTGLLRLDAACFAHGVGTRPGPGTHPVLLRAHADLLAAMGETNRVVALADTGGTSQLLLPAARARLLAGDTDGASAVARRALRDATVTPRDTLELLLVIAVVHLRSGDLDEARAGFVQAADLGRRGLLSSFALLPRDELLELCRLTGTDPRALGLSPTPGGTQKARPTVPIVVLTRRERAVLAGLASGATPGQIAAEDGVSVNTVRTQMRKVYRKLDVTNRASALARADQLGLIPSQMPGKN
jgi:LuxR family maltose regulon positive regulatory protein